jgi:hypothetical protein
VTPDGALVSDAAYFAREGGFRLLSGSEKLTKYLFNTKKNEHYFCSVCGVRPYGVGTETPVGRMYGVNLGCLEGISEEEHTTPLGAVVGLRVAE